MTKKITYNALSGETTLSDAIVDVSDAEADTPIVQPSLEDRLRALEIMELERVLNK